MFSRRWMVSLIPLSMLWLAACTRPQSDSSKIQIVIPAQMSSNKLMQSLGANDGLSHVVINVSGDGMSPIVFNWDSHQGSATTVAAPSSFNLDISTGTRLIQVLAVYENSATNAMSFYYGDVSKSLSQAQESVIIPISSMGGSTDVVSGHIAGRYLTEAGKGPTGSVEIMYTPPNKPPLIIERTLIVNGWFEVFGLTGLAFSYRLPDGRLLFDKAFDLNDPVLAASQKVLRVGMPVHYRLQSQNGSSTWSQEEAFIQVYGFFGPAADSSKFVCRPSTLPSMSKMARADSATGAVKLTAAAAALPAPGALLSVTSPLSSYYVEGGDFSSSTCTAAAAADRNLNFIQFYPAIMDGNGQDSGIGFRVPLEMTTVSLASFITASGDPRVLSAKVLPGVESVMDEVLLFKRPTPESNFRLENVDCFDIANGGMGYVPAGKGTVDAATRVFSVTSNITSAEASAGISGILCPLKLGQMAPRGIFLDKWVFSSSAGAAMTPASDFQLNLQWGSVVLGQCYELALHLTNGTNWMVTNDNTVNFTLASSGLGGYATTFYSETDASCSGSVIGTSVSLNPGETAKTLHFKISGTGSFSAPQIQATTSSFSGLTRGMGFTFATAASAATQLKVNMGSLYLGSTGSCMPLDILRTDINQFPVPSGAPEAVTISQTPSTEIGVFSDASCATSIVNSSFQFSAGEFYKRVYFQRLSGSSEATITFNDTGLSSSSYVIVDPLAYADHVNIGLDILSPSVLFTTADCIPLKAQLYDSSNVPLATLTNSYVVTLSVGSSAGGNFFSSSSSCQLGSGGSNPLTVGIGPSFGYQTFWYRGPLAGGAFTVQAAGSMRLANNLANTSFSSNLMPFDASSSPFSGLLAWFNLNSYYNQAVGNTIPSWASFMGGGIPALSSSGSVVLAGSNSTWKSAHFDGTSAFMQASGTLPANLTLAMRVKFDAVGVNEGVLQFYGSLCAGSSAVYSCNLKKMADGSIQAFGLSSAASLITDTNFHTLILVRSGVGPYSLNVFLDGNASPIITIASLTSPQAESFNSVYLGYTTEDGGITKSWLAGSVGDLLFFGSDQSANRSMIHGYLSQKYP